MIGPLFTAAEAALRLKISARAVYRLGEQHRIGFVRFGRSVRFSEQDLDEFVQRHHERPRVVGMKRGTR